MSASATPVAGKLGDYVIEDADAGTTVQYDVTGQGAGTLYGVRVDNTKNTVTSYIHFYDATSGVTVGTTDPEYIFPAVAGKVMEAWAPDGSAFSTGISYAVTTSGGTAGTGAPTSTVKVRLNAS